MPNGLAYQLHGSHACHKVPSPPLPRLRFQTMRPCRGVRIEDMGHKMGCNGVDNGKLWFDHVRVPRGALLDAHSQVRGGGEGRGRGEGMHLHNDS